VAYKRNYKQTDPKPILTNRGKGSGWEIGKAEAVAIGKAVMAAVLHGNPVYIQVSRYGSLTFKVYIEGDQFAELLNPGDDWDALTEEIVEALYDLPTVALVRRLFTGDAAGGPQTGANVASKGKTPGA
jgi:hypothetical protein